MCSFTVFICIDTAYHREESTIRGKYFLFALFHWGYYYILRYEIKNMESNDTRFLHFLSVQDFLRPPKVELLDG